MQFLNLRRNVVFVRRNVRYIRGGVKKCPRSGYIKISVGRTFFSELSLPGPCLSNQCCKGVNLLRQFSCECGAVYNGCPTCDLHESRAAFSDFFLCRMRVPLLSIFMEHFVHSMENVFRRKEKWMNGWRGSRKVAQVSLMEGAGCPPTTDTNIERARFCPIDG